MAAKSNIFWLHIGALLTFTGHRTLALDFEECASAPQLGVYVASHTNCSKYIYCAGAGSFEAECLGEHYYDDILERCVDRALVKRCQAKALDVDVDLAGNTTESPTIRRIFTDLIVNTATSPQPLAITLRLLHNAGPCYPYMVCYEGAGLAKTCTPAQLVSCAQRQPARAISSCLTGVYGFMPHPRNCAYFYYCSNGYKIIHRCPLNYSWNYEQRSCVQRSQQKCYSQTLRLRKQ
ncbi:LOW QUALITY PROTEIN: uncharacterized protein LOC111082706 [Drosophila obscura]|uniref:LOW QUALITY PROTEIN: uncharacterized protein LOC111082706 n=1 Tax=Drosophila obscura TaxID=7282 RepID=UPI001BB1AB59|nr:LOW QUALITY PROTEIN: uncharacterized protein LOC111082706 [Drosophila obscura]